MRASLVVLLVLAACFAANAQQATPRMTNIEPGNGKVGDVITAAGENLNKDVVSKVYLTDGTTDIIVAVTEQAATSIKFKIPEKIKPGRFALMLLTTGKEPKQIEQPVKLTIDE
jgi:hypothetical protein